MAAAARAWRASLARFVPEGRPLPPGEWISRHRAILLVTWAHAAFIPLFGLYRGFSPLQSLLEGGLVLGIGLVAAWGGTTQAFRESAAALALVTSSAIVVQFSGGYIEAHFHFFVVLALIALYQSWLPFLLAIGFVALDHGVIGALAPSWVYNHADAYAHPWKWALVHAGMVLAESLALMAAWKLTENARMRTDLVLESAAEGILGTSEAGEVVFANPAAAKLAGTSVSDLLGRRIDEFLPGLRDHAHAEGDFRAKHGLSPAVAVEYDSNPILRNGVAVGSVVTVKDIRDRKRVEAELTSAVSALAATLESTTDGILVIDRAGRIAHHNQRFVDIWRIPLDVLALGEDALAIRSVLHQLKEPAAFEERVQHLYASPEEESFDTLEFKDGRIVERFSRPHRLPSGEIIGRVWSFRDATERKRAEEAALSARVSRPLARMMVRAVFGDEKNDTTTLMKLGNDIAGQIETMDLDATLRSYANMGLGTLAAEELNGTRFVFAGSDLFERTEGATATTCHLALGFLCGSVSRLHGQPARGAEVACQSRGDACCRFIVSTKKPA